MVNDTELDLSGANKQINDELWNELFAYLKSVQTNGATVYQFAIGQELNEKRITTVMVQIVSQGQGAEMESIFVYCINPAEKPSKE